MAYEAMNNAGARDARLIVVLNDNDMSIGPPSGALSRYLARVTSSGTYLHLRDIAKQLAKKLPKQWERRAARMEELSRTYWSGGGLFEELGFYYVGPIDGHDFAPAPARAQECARHQAGADPGPCRHQEGQRLRAGRGLRRQVSRRDQVQRRYRRAGQAEGQGAVLHARIRRQPDRRGAQGRTHRRHHRGDARRHRHGSVRARDSPIASSMSVSPSSTR